MSGTEIRLSCAQPGDQIAIFGEALQEIAARSAHLYRDGDSYWFSPQPTLNKLADDRARDVTDEQADRRIVEILREEQRSRAGFPRVHAAPDNPTDIEDRRATALVILPPSAAHDAGSGPNSQAAALAGEIIDRRGGGQRRYRNALVFAAADASTIEAARANAKRERAWQSILGDADLMENLTKAQTRDAETQAARSRQSLQQSVRGAWVHILYPDPPGEGDGGSGYVMRSTRLVNRGGRQANPEAVWDKAKSDGTVLDKLGPGNLVKELEPLWPEEQPHLAIADIRDWFASYVYLPRLRDEAAIDDALQRLFEDLAQPYAYATAFDEDAGTYEGVTAGKALFAGDSGAGLLVRREAIRTEPPAPDKAGGDATTPQPGKFGQTPPAPDPKKPPPKPLPRRFSPPSPSIRSAPGSK